MLVGSKRSNYWITFLMLNLFKHIPKTSRTHRLLLATLSWLCFCWEPFILFCICAVYGPWMPHPCSSSPALTQPWFLSTWPCLRQLCPSHSSLWGRQELMVLGPPGIWTPAICIRYLTTELTSHIPYSQVMATSGRREKSYWGTTRGPQSS